jgi:glycosyltransferase involved in cell wall biosynthesis
MPVQFFAGLIKVKILIFPSWYPATPADVNGVFFREQAIALLRSGHQVGVLSANLRSIKQWKSWRLRTTPPAIINDEGVHTYRIHGTNWFPRLPRLNSKYQTQQLLNLYGLYERDHGRPDLIHVHSMLPAGMAALELSKSRGIPYVITEHSSAFSRGLLSASQLTLAGQVAQRAQQRWAVSSVFARLLEQQLGPAAGLWQTMPNIVNQAFLDAPLPDRATQHFVFLNICLHTSNKNVDYLLRAFAQQFRACPDVLLQLGGSGPQTPELIQLANQLRIAKQVQFLGMLSRDEVRAAMAAAHAFVLASQVETFGVVLIEALAMGLPLVATRCGGPEDIVTSANGVLVDPGNVQSLAAAMGRLHGVASAYEPSELRRDCAERFSEAAVTKQLQLSYQQVLDQFQAQAGGPVR